MLLLLLPENYNILDKTYAEVKDSLSDVELDAESDEKMNKTRMMPM